MNFLIVPDSFKHCLSSQEVGKYLSEGIEQVFPQAYIETLPVADGGEGTVDALMKATQGQIEQITVHDPLMRKVTAKFGVVQEQSLAVVEMAQASGIELLSEDERNPLLASTYGTGELIKAALDKECRKIIVGIGGSGTNDGGVGMARALGVKFLKSDGQEIAHGAGEIGEIATIDYAGLDNRISSTSIRVACDVNNLLYGQNGASYVYGPQKGADEKMVKALDKALRHLAVLLKDNHKIDVTGLQGGGAAGGIGAGLFAFLGAELVPGFELVAEILGLENKVKKADLIFTAEGSVDSQTLFGKTPAGVGRIARKYNKPLFVFTGTANDENVDFKDSGITSVIPVTRRPVSLDEAFKLAPQWLTKASSDLCKIIQPFL